MNQGMHGQSYIKHGHDISKQGQKNSKKGTGKGDDYCFSCVMGALGAVGSLMGGGAAVYNAAKG